MKTLAPIAIIAVAIGLYFLYITSATTEVKLLINKKNEYYTVLEKAKELTAKRNEIDGVYNNISSNDIDRLNKVIPEKLDPVLLGNSISFIASQNRIKVSDFKVGTPDNRPDFIDPTEGLPYKTNTVSLKVVGEYKDFLKFLENIESSLWLFDVVSFTAEPGTSDPTKPGAVSTMQFTLQINTYSLK